MADEVIGSPSLNLKVKYQELFSQLDAASRKVATEFEKSNSKLAKSQEAVMRQMQAHIDRLSGTKASNEINLIAQAVQQMGGVSKLSDSAVKQLTGDVERLAAAGAKVPKSLESLTGGGGGKLSGAFSALTSGGGITGALSALGPAGVAAGVGLGVVTAGVMKAGEAFAGLAAKAEGWSNQAEQTGLGVQQVQQLNRVVEDAGIKVEGGLVKALGVLQREIANGGENLKKFGISLADVSGGPEEALQKMASILLNIQDPMERAAAAQAAFGESGTKLIPILADVRDGVYKTLSAMSAEQVAELKKVDDELDAAGRAWERWKDRALVSLLHVGKAIAEGPQVNGMTAGDAMMLGDRRLPDSTAPAPTVPAGFPRLGALPGSFGGAPIPFKVRTPESDAADAAEAARQKAAADEKTRPAREAAAKKAAADRAAIEKAIADILEKQRIELQSAGGLEKALADKRQNRFDKVTVNDLVPSLGPMQLGNRNFGQSMFGGSALDLSAEGRLAGASTDPGEALARFAEMAKVSSAAGLSTKEIREELTHAGASAETIKLALEGTSKVSINWAQGLANIANTLQGFGGDIGKIGNLFAAGVTGATGIGAGLKDWKKASGVGGLEGILGKVGAAGQLAASAIGIGKTIVSLFKSDPVKDAQKQAGAALGHGISRELAEQLMKDAKEQGKSIAQVAREYEAKLKAQQKSDERATLTSGVDQAKQGAQTLMGVMDLLTPKAQAAGGALVRAVQDAMIANGLGYLANGELAKSESFNAAQTAVGGVTQIMGGMRQAGGIDSALLQNAGGMAGALQEQATAAAEAAGMAPAEATKVGFATIAPLLQEMVNSSIASGQKLSADQQALLDEAKKNGINIVADPMIESVAVQKESLSVLRSIAGQKGGGAAGRDRGDGIPSASGFGPRVAPNMGGGLGPLIQTHAGELVWVLPAALSRKGGIVHAAKGYYDDAYDPRPQRGTPSDASDPTTTASGGGTAAAPSSEMVAAVNEAVSRAVATIQPVQLNAPTTIQVVDNSLVRTAESVRQFEERAVGSIQAALDQRHAGLERRIEKIAERKLREMGV